MKHVDRLKVVHRHADISHALLEQAYLREIMSIGRRSMFVELDSPSCRQTSPREAQAESSYARE